MLSQVIKSLLLSSAVGTFFFASAQEIPMERISSGHPRLLVGKFGFVDLKRNALSPAGKILKIRILHDAALILGYPGKELKVLMVGNSFSQSVLRTLPQIAKTAGCQLKIANAMISGCTFERHVAEWEKCEKNPLYKPYTTNLKLSEGKLASLQDLLSAEKWDIVTIQQGSSQSPFPASYQYAASLITRIRTFLPEAEIMIQQTWSYRSDSDRLQKWKMSQKEMYDQLTSNYFKLANKNHFRIIPVGWAVELYRQNSGGRYMPISAEEMDKLKYPHVPATQNFDAVGNIFWRFNKQNGTWKLINDPIHLNLRGQYLQGCVWFAVLFQRNAETITFSPRNISAEDAAFIRNCAQKAIESFQRQ